VVLCERWRLVGPPVSALRGLASNHPVLRWLKTVVVSDRGKARLDRVRWGPGRRSRSAHVRVVDPGLGVVVEASKVQFGIKTGGLRCSRDEPGGCP
jgi:hypothetical protein